MSEAKQTAVMKPRVAFISGHIDLSQDTFNEHYKTRLDEAIAAGDSFILSSSRGADTLALNHLLAANVPEEKITVYLNTPLPPKAPAKGTRNSRKSSNPNADQTNRRDPAPAMIQRYEDLAVRVKVVSGDHTRRDTLMTRESDYDILWVRSEEETKVIYGKKWRSGRVSGTEKNRLRREVIAVGREAVGRRAIWEGEEVEEEVGDGGGEAGGEGGS